MVNMLIVYGFNLNNFFMTAVLRFSQTPMHQDLSICLRKKSLNLGINKIYPDQVAFMLAGCSFSLSITCYYTVFQKSTAGI